MKERRKRGEREREDIFLKKVDKEREREERKERKRQGDQSERKK